MNDWGLKILVQSRLDPAPPPVKPNENEEEKMSLFNANSSSGARPAASTSRVHPAAAAMLRPAWRRRPAQAELLLRPPRLLLQVLAHPRVVTHARTASRDNMEPAGAATPRRGSKK